MYAAQRSMAGGQEDVRMCGEGCDTRSRLPLSPHERISQQAAVMR